MIKNNYTEIVPEEDNKLGQTSASSVSRCNVEKTIFMVRKYIYLRSIELKLVDAQLRQRTVLSSLIIRRAILPTLSSDYQKSPYRSKLAGTNLSVQFSLKVVSYDIVEVDY